jgi:hypothetical protein
MYRATIPFFMTPLGEFICRICGKPVKLEESSVDAAGHPLHPECAVMFEINHPSELPADSE